MWACRSSSNWATRSAASSVSIRAIRSATSWSSRSSANSKLLPVSELFEQVGFQLGIVLDGGDDFLALPMGCGFDEVGQFDRVQACELRVRHAQLDRRDVTGERFQAGPVEEARDAHLPGASARGSSRRSRLCALTSIPTTRHQPSTRRSRSRSRARAARRRR